MITQFKIKVIEQNNGILFLFAPSDISKKIGKLLSFAIFLALSVTAFTHQRFERQEFYR